MPLSWLLFCMCCVECYCFHVILIRCFVLTGQFLWWLLWSQSLWGVTGNLWPSFPSSSSPWSWTISTRTWLLATTSTSPQATWFSASTPTIGTSWTIQFIERYTSIWPWQLWLWHIQSPLTICFSSTTQPIQVTILSMLLWLPSTMIHNFYIVFLA